MNRLRRTTLFFVSFFVFAIGSFAQNSIDPKLYEGMKWRLIGPFRGGRALTAVGVPPQPNT